MCSVLLLSEVNLKTSTMGKYPVRCLVVYNSNGVTILYVRNDAVFCNYNVTSFGNSEKKQILFYALLPFMLSEDAAII